MIQEQHLIPEQDRDAFEEGINSLSNRYQYDRAGNLIQEDMSGIVTHYAYNSLGKVIAQQKAFRAVFVPWPSQTRQNGFLQKLSAAYGKQRRQV